MKKMNGLTHEDDPGEVRLKAFAAGATAFGTAAVGSVGVGALAIGEAAIGAVAIVHSASCILHRLLVDGLIIKNRQNSGSSLAVQFVRQLRAATLPRGHLGIKVDTGTVAKNLANGSTGLHHCICL